MHRLVDPESGESEQVRRLPWAQYNCERMKIEGPTVSLVLVRAGRILSYYEVRP